MTNYMHHIPGRLRVRSSIFRGADGARNNLLRELRTIDGVLSVRLNQKAASVTIVYDTDSTATHDITKLLTGYQFKALHTSTHNRAPRKLTTREGASLQHTLTREIGKIAFNMLVSRGVSYSLSSLLGARI